ncbi:MAG: phosphotransferase [Gammaproteobacteria bacterium]|nr:phosphotransferase [Gammaproteobacteria bacterium]MCW5584226.1 phosphotransferase [Gammaproteobacteria bacterium]
MNNAHIQWARNILEEKKYELQSDIPDVIQDNPWSTVYRFQTNQGLIFLKQVPSALSLEPNVINLLQTEYHANVPFIIAVNREHDCFLMKDAGIQFHNYFKEHFNADIFIQMIRSYTKLQMSVTNKIQQFFDIGVPDWRLENLPNLYRDLINQESLLIDDGLSKDDLIKLKQLEPKLLSLCGKLASYKIKDTFGHADFHDKNILINPSTRQATIIDLGEVVITYPFFSLHNCLHMAKENFKLTDNQHHQLQLACFEPWLELESQKNLFDIISIINQCWSIHAALGEYRLIKSINKADFQKMHRQGRFARKLSHWINHFNNG